MKRFLGIAVLMSTLVLAGCGYRASTAECFRHGYAAGGSGPCVFTPLNGGPWEALNEADG